MKRDWDLIRTILVRAEEKPAGEMLLDDEISGFDLADVRHHIDLLNEAGYVKARVMKGNMGYVASAVVLGIEFQGYELLDTIRSKNVWERIKKSAKDKGVELTFEAVKIIGKAALEHILMTGSGS